MEVIKKQNFLRQVAEWYLFDIPKEILRGWRNYLKFNLNYFSVAFLLRTLFAPWRGYKWYTGKGFDLGKWLEVRLSNLFSRLIGAMMRTFLILIGLLLEVLIIFMGIGTIICWLILPLFLIFLLYHGFRILF